MVMELLNGQDLRQLLRDTSRLSVSRAAKLVSDACLGLVAVHAMGVIHRDLKPENLFVTHRDAGEECCKLLDFGVMKAEQGTSTQQGGLIGTLRYMAPEQIEHPGLVTAQSDVRSLAAILYECLTGKPPFEAQTVEQLLFRILNECAEPLRALCSDVPAELEAIVMRGLERDPSQRFSSARAFADALRPFANAPTLDFDVTQRDAAVPASAALTPVRARARSRVLLALAVTTTVGAVATVVGLRPSGSPLPRSESAPERPATESPRNDLTTVSTLPPADAIAVAPVETPALPSPASSPGFTGAHAPPASAPPAASNAPSAARTSEGKSHHTTELTSRQSPPAASHPNARTTTDASASPNPASGSFLRIEPASPYEH